MDENIQVKLGEYKGIQVPKMEIVITDAEINEQLENLRQRSAERKEKTAGAAVLGDQTVIDFVGYIDGEAFPGGDGTEYPLVLGSGTFIPGFEEQLVGAKKGDEVDVNVTFPADYHVAGYAGKDAVFKVAVKSIQTAVVPELSDELVAKATPYKTIPEFVDYLRKELTKRKAEQAAIDKENRILDIIVEKCEISVPDDAVEERAEALKQNMAAQLRNSGNTLEQYLQYNGLTEEQYNEYAKNDALAMLRGQAVLAAIAKKEGFTFTEQELNDAVSGMARSYQMEEAQLRQMMGEEGLAMLGEDIVAKKSLDFIVEQSVEV